MQEKVIIIGALPKSLINFRGELIKALSKKSKVIAMASSTIQSVSNTLNGFGVDFESFPIQRNGLNPVVDFKTYLSLRKSFVKNKPSIILAYTIKPIIWGGLASRACPNTKFFALVTGLGFAFQGGCLKRNILSSIVTFLYKQALKTAEKVIFQNTDNLEEFVSRGIVPRSKCVTVNGSGVNIDKFSFTPLPSSQQTVFLSLGRLLGEKGFREYAQAAKIVKQHYPEAIFQLQGPTDPSPDGLKIEEVKKWQEEGLIKYLGATDDVRPSIKACHIYVLPSYHEGMPRTVLEAMSIGRPILTTDVPGCRETVIEGQNGYLVPKQDAKALAERMIWFIENSQKRGGMGIKSRELAEQKYDVHKVNTQLIQIMGL